MNNDSEKLINSPENTQDRPDLNVEDHVDKLRARYKNIGEIEPEDAERDIEARAEALENAISSETSKSNKAIDIEPKTPAKNGFSKKDRKISYERTMKEVQSEMSAPSRAFSKVIHNRVVETSSEIIGSTIARPNAILGGSLAAFVLTFSVYMIAKTVGYPLSGFETIAAFVLGWILGILFDYFKVLITGKK